MENNKVLVFDMDGTIADLYGVDNWLEKLRNESPQPYQVAKPMYNPEALRLVLLEFKRRGWTIVVTTWLAKESRKSYDTEVRKAKLEWLDKMEFPYDIIHMVKYGTPKHYVTKKLGGFQIIVDDNEEVREKWTLGATIDAQNENVLTELLKLL